MFSVLMSVYEKEKVEYFTAAMDSVLNQTLLPDEIVLIRDGKVPEILQKAIDDYISKYSEIFTYIPLEENGGLGNALRIGICQARNEIIARMDTDDIAVKDRFEKQYYYMKEHPEVSVCGGQIIEFIDNLEHQAGKREVPLDDDTIKKFLKKRNAFNHMSVMLRKSKVIEAGNYQDLYYVEDYYLWLRMLLKNNVFANLPDTLVYARIGKDMYQRRGGYRYFKSWKELENYKYSNGITRRMEMNRTLAMRFVVQVLMPGRLRGWIMKYFSRKKV